MSGKSQRAAQILRITLECFTSRQAQDDKKQFWKSLALLCLGKSQSVAPILRIFRVFSISASEKRLIFDRTLSKCTFQSACCMFWYCTSFHLHCSGGKSWMPTLFITEFLPVGGFFWIFAFAFDWMWMTLLDWIHVDGFATKQQHTGTSTHLSAHQHRDVNALAIPQFRHVDTLTFPNFERFLSKCESSVELVEWVSLRMHGWVWSGYALSHMSGWCFSKFWTTKI